jgi:hypothetical protein
MIDDFTDEGLLPPGIYKATFEEVTEKLCFTNRRKDLLIRKLKPALERMKECGVVRVYLDGSFVTDRRRPGDIDVCYDIGNDADLDAMYPIYPLNDFTRSATKEQYGAEFFPSDLIEANSGQPFLKFFQTDREDRPRGIVRLDLVGDE